MKSVTNLNSKVYYHGQYWNDIPVISKYIFKKLTGDENKNWVEYFKEKYAQKPFNNALFLNCGDGRWERDFIDKGIVKKVAAFDISPELIRKAKKLKGKRDINYFVADANTIRLPVNTYDLVVNMAALHHVQYLNRLCLQVAKSLKSTSVLLSYDFVGPGRNQYPITNWFLIKLINQTLPRRIRKTNLGYPHLPTMLVTDPTEAIHSNLIDKTVRSYFDIIEKHDVGGGIAYEIFTHNENFSKGLKNSPLTNKQIAKVLEADNLLTKSKVIPAFFSLCIAKPDEKLINNGIRNRMLQTEENKRENLSQNLYGTYTPKDYLIMLRFAGSWRKRFEMLVKYFAVIHV